MDTSDLRSLLQRRRSVRHYTPEELPPEAIASLLADAAWAPSPGNEQPWAVTALAPPTARAVRERFERRGWNALLQKVAQMAARAGAALTPEETLSAAQEKIQAEGIVTGAPWLLLVHTASEPIDAAAALALRRRQLDRVPGRDVPSEAELLRACGPLNEEVVFAAAICFAYALTLAAEARGLGSCIQHRWLAFGDELARDHGIDPGRRLATAVMIGVPDGASLVGQAAQRGARRAPVRVSWR